MSRTYALGIPLHRHPPALRSNALQCASAASLADGQMQESAAQASNAPLLLVQLAQSKIEWQKLHDFLRIESGLSNEGQISRTLLRLGLLKAAMPMSTTQERIEEVYSHLDPEATGTIGFSELIAEIRRVRRIVSPMTSTSGPQLHRAPPKCGMVRGGSAPLNRARGPSAGLVQPDGSAYSVQDLERMAADFRKQGELGQALRMLEAALMMHGRAHGPQSDVALECSRQVADVCNSLGMQMLQRDDFAGCHALLKRAQARGQGDRAVYAITLNNLACYHRRRGHLKAALAHLSKAAEIEAQCDAHKPGDTHLNLCAVHSELGNHHEAMHHAKRALRLMRAELGLPAVPSPFAVQSEAAERGARAPTPSSDMSPFPAGGEPRRRWPSQEVSADVDTLHTVESVASPPDRMAVLAIAHHNLAVEQEALGLLQEASRSYAEAAALASGHLGPEHPVATALQSTHDAHVAMQERRFATAAAGAVSTGPRKANRSEREAAEARKQLSVQRHIEAARWLREHPGKRLQRRPQEASQHRSAPKLLAKVGEGKEVASTLGDWLRKNAGKVMDLFAKWDVDGNGCVEKSEFRAAMRSLGWQVPSAQIDAVFDQFDADSSGRIEFKELDRRLKATPTTAPKSSKTAWT